MECNFLNGQAGILCLWFEEPIFVDDCCYSFNIADMYGSSRGDLPYIDQVEISTFSHSLTRTTPIAFYQSTSRQG